MDETKLLADRFELERARLRAVAYRMLGSLTEAEDAVQETWIRLARIEPATIDNLSGWLTTVVSRLCLDVLRARKARPEDPLTAQVPDPIVTPDDGHALADSVGLALLVVLDTLSPAERLAFVLHDLFSVSFDDIAPIVDRTPTAARQLASRARRRVQDTAPVADPDVVRQREVVNAFLAASRTGDLAALVAVLDPDVLLRADRGLGKVFAVRGADNVAKQSLVYSRARAAATRTVVPVLINGCAGIAVYEDGAPYSLMAFTVTGGRVVEIDLLVDPDRLQTALATASPVTG